MPIHIEEGFTDTASSTLLIHFSEQRLHLRLTTAIFIAPDRFGVWGLDYIFTISGVSRVVSTELPDNQEPNEYVGLDYFSENLPAN
jgi:hypothetical protein